MTKRGIGFLAAALVMLPLSSPAQANGDTARLRLGEIRIHVFNLHGGTLSPDLLHSELPTGTWNLAIGGNGLEGPADDAVVVVPVLATKDAKGNGQVFSDAPITIRARNEKGRVVAQRTISGVLTSEGGQAYLTLWLPDVTCNGDLAIEAVMVRQRVSAKYQFRCGE